MTSPTLFADWDPQEGQRMTAGSTRRAKPSRPTGDPLASIRSDPPANPDLRVRVGRELAEAGAEAAEAAAGLDWSLDVEAVVRALADTGDPFTTDDVWRDVGDCPGDPRALGAVVLRLARAGVISKTGVYVPSTRVGCHARPIPVWRGSIP